MSRYEILDIVERQYEGEKITDDDLGYVYGSWLELIELCMDAIRALPDKEYYFVPLLRKLIPNERIWTLLSLSIRERTILMISSRSARNIWKRYSYDELSNIEMELS